MKLTFQQISDAALSLKKPQRSKLRKLLDESLDPPRKEIDDMDDAEFEAELNRRHEEAVRDPSVMIPMDVVLENMRKKYL
jgi:hypothetical protein